VDVYSRYYTLGLQIIYNRYPALLIFCHAQAPDVYFPYFIFERVHVCLKIPVSAGLSRSSDRGARKNCNNKQEQRKTGSRSDRGEAPSPGAAHQGRNENQFFPFS
jgi:hypothetical protein